MSICGFVNFKKKTTYLFLLLPVIIIVGGILIYKGMLPDVSDKIRYFGACGTVFAVLIAALQFRAVHDWNRRQFAMLKAYECLENLKEDMTILNKTFSLSKLRPDACVSITDIHKAVCRKDKVKEGKLWRDENENLEIDFKHGGNEIRLAIHNYLNMYEYIATGVHQNVFDKDVIKTLLSGNIQRCYFQMKKYIEHINVDMHSDRGSRIWLALKELAVEFHVQEEKEKLEREPKIKKREPVA